MSKYTGKNAADRTVMVGEYKATPTTLSDGERGEVQMDTKGNLKITAACSSIASGRKTVTTAGTVVPLVATPTPCTMVDISAIESNTDMVVIGGATALAGTSMDGAGTRLGVPIAAGQTMTVYVNDLSKIYLDAVVSGEGVSFTYYY